MPLSQYRILQLGSGIALDYCGKLFADFGADTIKLEPPGGDRLRAMPPIVTGTESGYFAWLNTNKRSVPETALETLIATADVLLDGRPPAESTGDHDRWRAEHPGLAITAISWFGDRGPYRDFAATDATCRALAGLVVLTGAVEGPPILATEGHSSILAGLTAFIPTMSGLYGREQGARRFTTSVHEASLGIAEYEWAIAWDAGVSRTRPGINRFGRNYPVGVYPTQRGMIGVTIVTPGQWRGICAMMGAPELAKRPHLSLAAGRLTHHREIDAVFDPIWLTKTAEQWFELGLTHKLPLAVVPTMAELPRQKVHRDRGVFVPVTIGGRTFEATIAPLHLDATPPKQGGTAPIANTGQPVWNTSASPAKPNRQASPGTLPLHGLKIVDLTMGWAGPTGARHLADLGAEVVKVEACQYPDWWRGTDLRAAFIAEQRYEKIPWFQLMNRNKRGVTLDLTRPDGVALLKRLVAGAHAVIENYSSEVLRKLHLDYSVLKDVRPGLVMLSMPAFGSFNAWSECRAYGSTLEHASGLPAITGFPDDPPTMNQTAYGDPVGGYNAAAALTIALLHQQRTGQGQNIDLSQVECMLPLAAPALIEQSALDRTAPRLGNRHPTHVPHGCFRCMGADDSWIVIAVTDDTAWRALANRLGRADLAALTAPERRAREAELEAIVAAWTANQSADAAMASLQSDGIAASVARRPFDLLRDPHLVARGYWRQAERPFIGTHYQSSAAFRDGPDPLPLRHTAPTLGQDNEAILAGLGLDRAERDRLAALGITGTVPNPRRAQGDA